MRGGIAELAIKQGDECSCSDGACILWVKIHELGELLTWWSQLGISSRRVRSTGMVRQRYGLSVLR